MSPSLSDLQKAIEPAGSDQCRLFVRLSPGASKNQLNDLRPGNDGRFYLAAQVTQVPEKGKANKALVALLAKSTKLPKSAFTLERGETDRQKQFLVNCPADQLAGLLSR